MQRHPLRQRMFAHPFRDLTVMHLEREHEEAFARGLRATNTGLCRLYTGEAQQGIVSRCGLRSRVRNRACPFTSLLKPVVLERLSPPISLQNLRCHGHRTTRDLIAAERDDSGKPKGADGADPQADAEAEGQMSEEEARRIASAGVPLQSLQGETPMPPDTVAGMFLGANEVRGFAKTASVLVTGMCGGPMEGVVAPSADGGDEEETEGGLTLGMCEGVLTEASLAALLPQESGSDSAGKRSSVRDMLADAAVMVPAAEIYAFIQHVERTELQLK